MKYSILGVMFIVMLLVGSFGFASPVLLKQKIEEKNYVEGQVILIIEENTLSDIQIENYVRSVSPVKIKSVEKAHDYYLAESDEEHGKRLLTINFNKRIDPEWVANIFSTKDMVLMASPNYILKVAAEPNDPLYGEQWGLHKIGAPAAWDISEGNGQTIIAIIDTGADLDHEDLQSKLLPSWDAVENDNIPEDDHGHGTAVTGIAAAATNNGLGVAGTCPECKILPVRACYNNGGPAECNAAFIILAIEYAVDNPDQIEGIPPNPNVADIISMSFITTSSVFLLMPIQSAYAEGAVLVAAAGNNNNNDPLYPAAYPEVIGVGGTDQNDYKVMMSNYGDWVDVGAPGTTIKTTYLDNTYNTVLGTSFATPFVAGLAALIMDVDPALTQEEIRNVITSTTDPVVGDPFLFGRISASRALQSIAPINTAPVMQTIGPQTGLEAQLLSIDVNATDPEGDTLTYYTNAGEVLPSAFTFDQQTGLFEWTPQIGDAGTYSVNFNVTDGELWDSQDADITIRAAITPGGSPLFIKANVKFYSRNG